MPYYPPFNFPFLNNYRFLHNSYNNAYPKNNSSRNNIHNSDKKNDPFKCNEKKVSEDAIETPEAFFEIFGLKLYFDDILILCILFFLYTEQTKDEELFICLILLLLS